VKLRTIVAAGLAAAVAAAAPLASPSPASAALSCSKWTDGDWAYGKCEGSGRWRVVALCEWQFKQVGPWVEGSRESNAGPCDWGASGAVIEFD
jgi:hypothetical protein